MIIEKLKVVEIFKTKIIVETSYHSRGYIHISKCAYRYIDDLENYFTRNEYIYGVKINKENLEYSLIMGHTMNESQIKDRRIIETGGGFNILNYHLEKWKKEIE